eukprot:TRINITY_DN10416_c0_g1_i1.p1 TRINITY_DN10416_c0_g1~~TRINITY_DN10416_c0_g1_i1.p1  ORF type:complete len:354 (-),score=99.27 TRINITY_DN10416_c0_g1_i1:92-1153(-)
MHPVLKFGRIFFLLSTTPSCSKGGYIKNAVLSAVTLALRDEVKTESSELGTISQKMLREAAKMQSLSRLLGKKKNDMETIPTFGLADLVLEKDLLERLESIIHFEKSKTTLTNSWGFKNVGQCAILFVGPQGTGKTSAAMALAHDLGRTIQFVNCAQLMSKYHGETAKNISKVFDTANVSHTVVCFDQAEELFTSRQKGSRSKKMETGILLHYFEQHKGVTVVILDAESQTTSVDPAFLRRFTFVIRFEEPQEKQRTDLWKAAIPSETPVSDDIDFALLGSQFQMNGGEIRAAVLRAASQAIGGQGSKNVQTDLLPTKAILQMKHLVFSARETIKKRTKSAAPMSKNAGMVFA